jgi:glycosyltransferase involved in cell wall biosynthesis
MRDELISFVVPAHNEEQLIGRTLTAIHAAARELAVPYELIVVDDGSSDRTAAIGRAHGARVIGVAFRQIARARNAGGHAATGATLIFVDADTVVQVGTLRAAIRALEAGAVGGGATITFDGHVPVWGTLLLPVVRALLRTAGVPAGCFVFCSHAAFHAVGGFDERLYAAEEIAFGRALRREGPVVTLAETVLTSGRKLRTHSVWEALRLFASVARRGTSSIYSRDQLSMWYGLRRDDPDTGERQPDSSRGTQSR